MSALAMTTGRWLDERGMLPALAAGSALLFVAALQVAEPAARQLAALANGIGPLALALAATLGTAAATGLGALPVLFLRKISARTNDTVLGFAAGIMLGASFFSLILPALDAATEMHGSRVMAGLIVAAAVALGAGALLVTDRLLPHEHRIEPRAKAPPAATAGRVWLFVLAITLHNIPEGLAVGVAFAGESAANALPLAIGIALQNAPEGLAVALALVSAGYAPARAALLAFATGLVEPLGGILGAGIVGVSQALLPWGLAFAAGAMLFVVSHEIIPETHRKGHETWATAGLMLGCVTMMLFDVALA